MTQPLQLGCLRSDYMNCRTTGKVHQIELNTIAASFGTLMNRSGKMHKFLCSRHFDKRFPHSRNDPPTGLAKGIAIAAQNNKGSGPGQSVVLFVVQEGEKNAIDQRGLEYALWENHQLSVIRKTLAEVMTEGEVMDNGDLTFAGKRVAVVYFRAGYTPNDYPSEREWDARDRIEFSTAVKC